MRRLPQDPVPRIHFMSNEHKQNEAAIRERCISILSEQLGFDLDKIKPESTPEDLGVDSLDGVEIEIALEEDFEIEFDRDEFTKIKTVEDMVQLVATKVLS